MTHREPDSRKDWLLIAALVMVAAVALAIALLAVLP